MLPLESAPRILTPFDELSVSFENPATDAMGYNAVQGKLYCGVDQVQIQFKQKDRAFRKGETTTVDFDYGEVETTELISRWLRPKILVFATRSPEKLDEFPGAKVGRVELRILPESIANAKKVEGLIDFKQSEAFLTETESRIGRDTST
ncbi:MAG: hypothetical protein L7V87_06485 [Verrucomicrobiales bacterium]|jgi:hypothetical protein|nr:hypothetical protein [Verrucomicrobiales bacterium]